MVKQGLKQEEKSEYKTLLGGTKYAIPMFGYKSAFALLAIVSIMYILSIYTAQLLDIDFRWTFTIFVSLGFGLSIGISQFFIERKKGFTRNFFLLSMVFTAMSLLIFYLCLFKGILI